jgi:ribosome modulation factor
MADPPGEDPFDAGVEAFDRGVSCGDCPYPEGSAKRKAWLEGWNRRADGGMDPTTLGHHSDAYPFVDGLPDAIDAEKNLDAAIFTIADPDIVSSMQRGEYDTPSECIPLEIDMQVTKVGRTTGKTGGKVVSELFDFEPIIYEIDIIGGKKIVYFKSLFAIVGDFNAFSQPGDSGSLIVTSGRDDVKKAVGILVAADENGLTFALSLDSRDVLQIPERRRSWRDRSLHE